MSWGRVARTTIAFAILVVLHYMLRPVLAWRAEVDFLVIAVLLVAVRQRPGLAAVFGFLVGLVSGSLVPDAFGAAALAMSVVAFGAAYLKAVFFADNLALNGFFFFLGKWVFDIVTLTVERRVHGVELVMELLLWSSLSAALTAIAGVLVLVLLRPVLEASPT